MTFYMFGDRSRPEEIPAVTIAAYDVTDEQGNHAGGYGTHEEAGEAIERLEAKYPNRTFTIS